VYEDENFQIRMWVQDKWGNVVTNVMDTVFIGTKDPMLVSPLGYQIRYNG